MVAATSESSVAEPSASAYAEILLRAVAPCAVTPVLAPAVHPALAWATSGLMALAGSAEEAPRMCPAPLASCADGALAALASLAPGGMALSGLRGAGLLAERAALLGLRRSGPVSPGGACRLYRTTDGSLALNLARDEDRETLPALLELDAPIDPLRLPELIATRGTQELVERGRTLGLAIAASRMPASAPASWFNIVAEGRSRGGHAKLAPRVLELASLWAGPLCGHLLHKLGAEVIKIESPQRPDGARQGHAGFFDLLNAGKRSVALDLRNKEGREHLLALIASADIVIEGSRPRALRQLGIEAEALVAAQPGLTWLAISGHGRGEPQENWVAYGDDAAVAAGLSAVQHAACGEHLIVGDAIADPLTGIHAALAAWARWRVGGGGLVSLALRDVVAHCLAFDLPASAEALKARQSEWTALALDHGVRQPQPRQPAGIAPALGADTTAVLAALGRTC